MNIRWLWGNYIEPEWKLSRAEVRTVHRLVHQRYMSKLKLWGMTGGLLLAALAAMKLLHAPLTNALAYYGYVQGWALSMAIIAVSVIIGSAWMYRIIYTRPVRRAMRELGYDLCVPCGYWLRELPEEIRHCPECGALRDVVAKGDTA